MSLISSFGSFHQSHCSGAFSLFLSIMHTHLCFTLYSTCTNILIIYKYISIICNYVHTDPHEANILVRAHPYKKQHAQVVLLDHGLYRQLEEGFRLDYCRLWQGIVLGACVMS